MRVKKKRKICFIITSLIHYSRNMLILDELHKRSDVDLCIVIGGSAVLPKYHSKLFNLKEVLEDRGFENIREIYFNLDGDASLAKAKTMGLAISELSSVYAQIEPNLIVIRGDRFEVLAAASAAACMNIPIAHIEGGDVSGSIDESIRHAVTKLAQIHFTTNEQSRERVLQMGEGQRYVFDFGSPDVEIARLIIAKKEVTIDGLDIKKTGSGSPLDIKEDFLTVMYHPVTTEIDSTAKNTKNLLETVREISMPTLWFWPNFDAGSEIISREIRKFVDKTTDHKIRFMRYLPPEQFLRLLSITKCLVGNSSAGVKECSSLGTPVVNIGSRQSRRLSSENVINVGDRKGEVKEAILFQLARKKRYTPSYVYYKKNTSKNIAKKMATVELYVQKRFVKID